MLPHNQALLADMAMTIQTFMKVEQPLEARIAMTINYSSNIDQMLVEMAFLVMS